MTMAAVLGQAINLALAALLVLVALGGRNTVTGLIASLSPDAAETLEVEPSASGSLVLPADRSGHFLVTARVNGEKVRFLIDTGASNVVLSRHDADRLRLPLGERDFTQIYSTPGGVVRAAPVRLAEVHIGARKFRNVRASVSERPMDVSLLGISFLGRLASYEVSGGKMTLRW
jgi:aspartyl protease family protein